MAIALDPKDPIARQMQGSFWNVSGHFIEAAANIPSPLKDTIFAKGD